MNGKYIKEESPIAKTLMARDYKGFGTGFDTQNGVIEQSCLHPVRIEYGKKIRSDYENHKVHEKRKNMTQLEPKDDGLINTLTTVQKDNMILESKRNESAEQKELHSSGNNRDV